MIDTELSSEAQQVRAYIGDTDKKLISDQTIDALLITNDDNVKKTSIQALQFIVADCAKKVDQEVGDVKVWYSQKYEQMKDLLDKLQKDPSFGFMSPALHLLGGTSRTAAGKNRGGDNRSIPLQEKGRICKDTYNSDNPYFLDGDGDCY